MFSSKKIYNDNTLGPVLKAAHNLLPKTSVENICLPETCDVLHSWIKSNEDNSEKRLSLRTSATLVAGTAKIYKTAVDTLFEDVQKLEKQLLQRNRPPRKELTASSETTVVEIIQSMIEEILGNISGVSTEIQLIGGTLDDPEDNLLHLKIVFFFI